MVWEEGSLNLRKILNYQTMMMDRVRMSAFHAAIGRVAPGSVVVELGVGLGPLSMMALNAGARRVYGIEADEEALETAVALIANAGLGDRFVAVAGVSQKTELPEPADVLISETLDASGVGENTCASMRDAAARFLSPDGVVVPGRLSCFAALASPGSWDERHRFWSDGLREYGLDYSMMGISIREIDHRLDVAPEALASDWKCWRTVEFRGELVTRRVLLRAARAGEITGLALGFRADLVAGVSISTLSGEPPTHWQQGFYPFSQPIRVEEGDAVVVDLKERQHDSLYARLGREIAHIPRESIGEVVAQVRARRDEEG